MSSEQLSLAKKQLYSLFKMVRKEAVPLVDAFDIPDGILNSVLGRYDGDVYTHLYQWAQKAPRNKEKVKIFPSKCSCYLSYCVLIAKMSCVILCIITLVCALFRCMMYMTSI